MLIGNVKIDDSRLSTPVEQEQANWLAERSLAALSERQLRDIGLARCGSWLTLTTADGDYGAEGARETSSFALPAWLRRVLAHVTEWWKRAEQRRVLASQSDFMLRDMGLTRLDVDMEVRKPFWRA
jgi:uncharacterized protein YjiS (DUF1127 family)